MRKALAVSLSGFFFVAFCAAASAQQLAKSGTINFSHGIQGCPRRERGRGQAVPGSGP